MNAVFSKNKRLRAVPARSLIFLFPRVVSTLSRKSYTEIKILWAKKEFEQSKTGYETNL